MATKKVDTKKVVVEAEKATEAVAAAPAKEAAPKATKKAAAPKKVAVKKPAAKKPAAKKAATKKEATSTVLVQFAGTEAVVADVVAAAEAAFKAENKRKAIDDLKVYIKPEEKTAYYVVTSGDKEYVGSVGL